MLNLKEAIMWGFLVLAGLGLVYTKGHTDGTNQATLQSQAALIAANRKLEESRNAQTASLALVSGSWQKALKGSQESAARTIADLRDRGIGLRVQLADATVRCTTGDGRPLADGTAELRSDTAQFLVEQAQRADAQVKGLQATVRILQGGTQ